MKHEISVNQFAEFTASTDAKKRRILSQQLVPNKVLIPWYQQAKSSIREYLKDVRNASPLDDGIAKLLAKNPDTTRKMTDIKISIEALEKVKSLPFPSVLKKLEYQLLKPDQNAIVIDGVTVKVAPDIVIKAKYRGQIYLGAVKIHICKNNPFDYTQGQYVATLLKEYVEKVVAKKGEKVLPEICLCFDVFSDRAVPAGITSNNFMKKIREHCLEILKIYETLA